MMSVARTIDVGSRVNDPWLAGSSTPVDHWPACVLANVKSL